MKYIILITLLLILFSFSCSQRNNSLVNGDNAYSDVKAFGGVTSAISEKEGTITVYWRVIGGASEYRVYLGNPQEAPVAVIAPGDSDSAVASGLAVGKSYSVYVRAADSYGNEDTNKKFINVVVIDQTPPLFPPGFFTSLTKTGDREVELAFLPAALEPTIYEIRMCSAYLSRLSSNPLLLNSCNLASDMKTYSPNSPYQLVKTIDAVQFESLKEKKQAIHLKLDQTSHIGDDMKYFFQIRSCDKFNNCDDNQSILSIDMNDTPRNENQRLAPIFDDGSISKGILSAKYEDKNIIVTWDAPVGETKTFKIFASVYQGPSNLSWNWGTPLAAVDYPLMTGQFKINDSMKTMTPFDYAIAVKAEDSFAKKNTTLNYVIVPVPDITPPTFHGIDNFETGDTVGSSLAKNDTSLILIFTPSPDTDNDLNHYNVYKLTSTSDTSMTPFMTISDKTATSVLITNLTPNDKSVWRIRAVDNIGNTDENNSFREITIPDYRVPEFSGIKTIREQKDNATNNGYIELTWDKGFDHTPPIHYNIYRSEYPTINIYAKIASVDTLIYQDKGTTAVPIKENTLYSYKIQACDDRKGALQNCQKLEDISAVALNTTNVRPPQFDAIKSCSLVDKSTIRVKWEASTSTDLLEYALYNYDGTSYISLNGAIINGMWTLDPADNKLTYDYTFPTPLIEGQDYYFSMTAIDTGGLETLNTQLSKCNLKIDDLSYPDGGEALSVGLEADHKTIKITATSAHDAGKIGFWYLFMSQNNNPINFPTKGDTNFSCSGLIGSNCLREQELPPLVDVPEKTFYIDLQTDEYLNAFVSGKFVEGGKYRFGIRAKDKSNNISQNEVETPQFTMPDVTKPILQNFICELNGNDIDISFKAFDPYNTDIDGANLYIEIISNDNDEFTFSGATEFNGYANNTVKLGNLACGTKDGSCKFTIANASMPTGRKYIKVVITDDAFGRSGSKNNGWTAEDKDSVARLDFQGWKNVKAIGYKHQGSPAVNASAPPSVTLEWDTFNSPVDNYNIYRSPKLGDIGNLVGTVAGNVNVFNDPTLTALDGGATYFEIGKRYYYRIIPVLSQKEKILGDIHGDMQIEVIIPPANMVFINRWIANREVCKRLGKSIERNNQYSCNMSVGDDYYDIGAHYFIDRWEATNVGEGNLPDLNPYVSIAQTSAQSFCQSKAIIAGDHKISKALLSRQIQLIASAWPESMTSTEIDNIEAGNITYGCNSKGAAKVTTGSAATKNCVSRFGAQDMVGNVWEWTSDQIKDGYGQTGLGLDESGFATNFNFTSQAGTPLTKLFFTDLAADPYLLIPIGIPLKSSQLGAIFNDLYDDNNIFVSGDYFYFDSSGTRGGITGGSFNYNNTMNPSSLAGRYTLSFEKAPSDTSVSVGFRCGVRLGNLPRWEDAQAQGGVVKLAWKNLNMFEELVKYNVYRSETPMAPANYKSKFLISTSQVPTKASPFVDTVANSSDKTYYYLVTFVKKDGIQEIEVDPDTDTNESGQLVFAKNDVQIEILSPALASSKFLLHRWIWNQKLCSKYGKPSDPEDNYRCYYKVNSNPSFPTEFYPWSKLDLKRNILAVLCNGPDDCYTNAQAKDAGAAINTVDFDDLTQEELIFWSKSPNSPKGTDFPTEQNYIIGHWYKDFQYNMHLVDNYANPNVKNNNNLRYRDVTAVISDPGGPNSPGLPLARSGSGLYYTQDEFIYSLPYPPGTSGVGWWLAGNNCGPGGTFKGDFGAPNSWQGQDPNNYINRNSDTSNPCYSNRMRLPLLSETSVRMGVGIGIPPKWGDSVPCFTSDATSIYTGNYSGRYVWNSVGVGIWDMCNNTGVIVCVTP